jgi:hypothetical protein
MRISPVIPVLAIVLGLAFASPLAALPADLHWGMGEEACTEALLAAGYAKIAEEIPERSEDRKLRRHAIMGGIRWRYFEKRRGKAREELTILLYNDSLFRVRENHSDFGPKLKEEIIERLTREFSSAPRQIDNPGRLENRRAPIERYAWSRATTTALFSYQRIPRISLLFAEIDYFDRPIYEKLKNAALQ